MALSKADRMAQLIDLINQCRQCTLFNSRPKMVFGDGSFDGCHSRTNERKFISFYFPFFFSDGLYASV